MNAARLVASGFAAGAAFMYLSDPVRGKRRRALARDQSARALNEFSSLLDKARRDAGNRARGLACEVKAAFRNDHADDQILVQRVRSRLGRLASHPHAIEVTAENGRITLSGPILEAEAPSVIKGVLAVPGVGEVENRLESHPSAEHISSLQGGSRRESRSEIMQQNWTPALRIGAGAIGSSLLMYGFRNNGILSFAGSLAGAALLGRAICNHELRDIVGIGDGARGVHFDKTVHIQAPVEEVFRHWSDYQKLPRFMTHLREVRDLGDGKSHWVAEGPGGVPVSWDAEITEFAANKLLAWRSIPGSTVNTEGVVRFDEEEGGTRVTIRMSYCPPAGVLGHYVAALFGTDPKSEMDDDMIRLKSLLETGKTRAHGMEVRRETLEQADVTL